MATTPPRRQGPSPGADPAAGPERPVTVADILDGRASGIAEPPTGKAGQKSGPMDELAEFKDMLAEQRTRQERLRHVQQFLSSPMFLDLSDRPVQVSEDRAAIDERKHDLDYRIRVLESLCAILIEERDFLDRLQSPEEAARAAEAEARKAG